MSKKGEILKNRFGKLAGTRANWEQHWEEIAKFILPKKDDVYGSRNKGEKKGQALYDSTAIHSNELLASALHSMLTNPSLQFFGLSTGDKKLDKNDKVRKWLQDVVDIMHDVMNNSNFQTQIHEVYVDLGSFGTSVLRIEEDEKDLVRFHSRPIYESYIKENSRGIVDTVYRTFTWEVRKIIQQWGVESLPNDIQKELKMDSGIELKEFEIVHSVEPRDDLLRDKRFGPLSPQGKAISSIYWIRQSGHVLKEEGFNEFPYAVPRWTKISSEIYGRSPGMKSLPDIKMLNEVMRVQIRGAQKAIDPAVQIPDDGFHRTVRLYPGGINHYRAGTNDKIEPINVNPRIDLGQVFMDDIRIRIKQAYFADQLQLREGPQMTATEVRQRTEEQLRLLGPILGRQHNELLKPLVERVYGILLRKNMFPVPPQELSGFDLKVNYVSQIAKAQKASEADNLLRVLQSVAPLIEFDPTIMDNIDSDEAFLHAADMFDLPQELITSDKEKKEIRGQRAKQQQQQQQQEQNLAEAETVQKLGGAQ